MQTNLYMCIGTSRKIIRPKHVERGEIYATVLWASKVLAQSKAINVDRFEELFVVHLNHSSAESVYH
jgi:hypothetical protein